ncbi:MAG TPA: HpcH/HpaI aldolase/citrate lyase family protein [Dongiaceae bacterium]|jgi:4-hydroxy-2-oxoheptanedioate aldolase|nr:HpcH/HpaI aldolase/citrate lyase family protein [Dongiaceae bacterium]
MASNPFKDAIQAGRVQIGLWSSMCSVISTEIAADAGFDWILLDAEHSPVEVADLYPLLQASARGTAHAAVRLAWNDKVLIKRALDIGAQTILVPFVQNAEEARQAALACGYPPHGVRGVAGSTRATRYGRDKSYFKTARDGICLIVQVETVEALRSLEAIAAVDGVDAVFIGPSDLAASMGHIGNPGHEDVQQVLLGAVERLKAVGKPAGILAVTEADAKRYRDWGYVFVAAGVDTVLFARSVDALAAGMKADGKHS